MNEIVPHAGKISHKLMSEKAHREFDKFDQVRRIETDRTPSDFDKFVEETKKQTPDKKRSKKS